MSAALEQRGRQFDFGAPVTAAVSLGDTVVVSFGDGRVRFFTGDEEPRLVHAHEGVVLAMAGDTDGVLTGGDDGRFLRISLQGDVEELAKGLS